MQGLMVQVGSLGRTVAPVFMTQIFTHFGPAIAWGSELALIAVALLLTLASYTRLVPLKMVTDMKHGDKVKHKGGAVYRF